MSWALYETDGTGQWRQVPKLKSLNEATRYIIEAESIPTSRLVAELHLDGDAVSDEAAIAHVEFKGERACYVMRRVPS
jgi:hypothetical protein